MWLNTALSSEEVEQLERPENVETLTEISCIRWDRQGHHPVREEVRRSAARAVDEIAAFQIKEPVGLVLERRNRDRGIYQRDSGSFALNR